MLRWFIALVFGGLFSAAAAAQPLPPLYQWTGYLAVDGSEALYPLFLTPGVPVTVQVERLSGDLLPFIALQAPSGMFVARSRTGTDRLTEITLIPNEGGEYLLIVGRQEGAAGTTSGAFLARVDGGEMPDGYAVASRATLPARLISEPGTYQWTGTFDDAQPQLMLLIDAASPLTITAELRPTSGDLRPYLVLTVPTLNSPPTRGTIDADGASLSSQLLTGQTALLAGRFDLAGGTTSGTYLLSVMITAGG